MSPPLTLPDSVCSSDVWSFLCEDIWWSWSHVLVPLTIQLIGRRWIVTLVLMYANEVIETIIRAIMNNQSSVISETQFDSLIGDTLCGILGIVLAESLLKYARWSYTFVPSHFWSWAAMLRAIFVVIVLCAPVFGSAEGFSSVPIGLAPFITIFTYPVLVWSIFWCYGFSRTWWWRVCVAHKVERSPIWWRTPITADHRALVRMLVTWTVVAIVFTASLTVGYTHIFLQAVIHAVVLTVILLLLDLFNLR